MKLQDLYQKAINFAGEKHRDQKMPGNQASYLVHLSNVAMEVLLASRHQEGFNTKLAVQVAILHDTMEDTDTSFEELKTHFGIEVADAVKALSKNEQLETEQQIPDSLARIRLQPKEIWAVKLADRISNMQEPPENWDKNKRIAYQLAARMILMHLKGGNDYLEKRLEEKILAYDQYIN
ncbi:HD domain-containing protein [Lutimonas zeaxanthinifaciens]|uniref:HD domain-containing protein n=1 Tax=Lutimonas zeaxanthinifaciens TaxID=3060215 RepID=UPI00265CB289|nr:HD domain-containing protein [Lutimonas sp. YSD2104]WKK66453.1 HD domain-containing protein [Lutimonas sp. YSD2104]